MDTPMRRLASSLLCGSLLALTGLARADNILVYQRQNEDPFQGDTAGPNAATVLRGLGHTVTQMTSLTAILPQDLTPFDTIWIIQLLAPTGVEQTALVEYVKRGGSLYLTGERPCCEDVNSGVSAMVISTTIARPQIGRLGEGGDDFVADPLAPFGLTTTPNAVTEWKAGEAGVMRGVPNDRVVFRNPAGGIGAAAFAGEDLDEGAGCLYVAMDLSFWFTSVHPEYDERPLIENIQRFLSTCADSDHDGATDGGEVTAGTNPDDPDTDGDGVCDGWGEVAGVCIRGETLGADSDDDGVVDSLDDDDDNDGIPTSVEAPAEATNPNADEDRTPTWRDVDSDGDNRPDAVEGMADRDEDGIPGLVDLGDEPENCDSDEDCVVYPPETVCNQETGFCSASGGPVDGGTPIPDGGTGGRSGEGGAAPESGGTGSGTGGRASGGMGGRAPSDGGVGSPDGGPGSTASSGDDGGCGCRTAGNTPGAPTTALAALAALVTLARRRSRPRRASH